MYAARRQLSLLRQFSALFDLLQALALLVELEQMFLIWEKVLDDLTFAWWQ